MSVLIYKGNPVDNFGEFLPVPYIEKIEIHNDGGYQIYLSLFLMVDDGEDVDRVKERLNAVDDDGNRILTNYILLLTNKPADDQFDKLFNAERNIFSYYVTSSASDGLFSRTKLDVLEFFDKGEVVDDFYDKNGNRILKFNLCYGCEGTAGSFVEDLGGGSEKSPGGTVTFTASGGLQVAWPGAGPGMGGPIQEDDEPMMIPPGTGGGGGSPDPPEPTNGDKGGRPLMEPIGDRFGREDPEFDTQDDAIGPQMDPIGDRFGHEDPEIAPQEEEEEEEVERDRWAWICDMWVFAFSSTYDYFNSETELDDRLSNHSALFKKEISDLAYEPIFVNCELVDGYESVFFDSDDAIYNGDVMKSFGGLYYKAENITYDQVEDYMNELISEYEPQDNTPLKKVTDNISYILATYGQSDEILQQLDTLRRIFPSKSSATEVGRLYKRFSKRIFTINNKLKINPQVFIRIIRNPKILDLRTPEIPAWSDLDVWRSQHAINDSNYLYNSSYMGRSAIYSLPDPSNPGAQEVEGVYEEAYIAQPGPVYDETVISGGDPIDEIIHIQDENWPELPQTYDAIVRNFGYFFFDYEKALKTTAVINKIFSVSKLENYGIESAYDYYKVTNVTITRDASMVDADGGEIIINSRFRDDISYPLTEYSLLENNTTDPDYAINRPGYDSTLTDYSRDTGGETGEGILTQEEAIYLLHRNFEPVNGAGVTRMTPNYRLMCFEFQDFMDDDKAWTRSQAVWQDNEYTTTLTIEDTSFKIYLELNAQFDSAKVSAEEYLAAAELDAEYGSYDKTTGLFNTWFVNGIESTYVDQEVNAPWYRAPILYNIFKDLFYDTFGGDMSLILKESRKITTNIAPYTGSFYALEQFVKDLEDLVSGLQSDPEISDLLASVEAQFGSDYEGILEHVFEGKVSYNSSGNGEIYGVVYYEGTAMAAASISPMSFEEYEDFEASPLLVWPGPPGPFI